jgi:predicted amidophosphoribosyltransferase
VRKGDWDAYVPQCLKKCGNKTTHKSGICNICRSGVCSDCGIQFVYKKERSDLCSDCRNKRRKSRFRKDVSAGLYTLEGK